MCNGKWLQEHLSKNYNKMKIFELYNSLQRKIWSFKSYLKLLIESLFCVLRNRIKKSESPFELREKILNFIVKWWKNCKFWRALAQFRGKMSCISWRHNSISQVFAAKVGKLAIPWRQNNGKMAKRDRRWLWKICRYQHDRNLCEKTDNTISYIISKRIILSQWRCPNSHVHEAI